MLKYLLEKEVKQIFRNSFMPKLLVFFPLLMMLLLPQAADLEIKNVDLAIVDNSKDNLSKDLIRSVSASGYFDLVGSPSSYADAMELIEYGDANIILEIPLGFEEALINRETPVLLISANSVNGTEAGLGSSYLARIIKNFETKLNKDRGLILPAQDGISVTYRFNDKMDYKTYMIPALMVILLTLLCGFLPAINIVIEKENGTIEQINVTPVTKIKFILGKLIPYWVMGFLVLNICFLIAYLVYGLYPQGSVFTIYIFALLYIFAISCLGLIISNYSDVIQQAMYVMLFFILIFILMSGLFTPISSMPQWAQYVTALNPLTYFNIVMRGVYLKGATITDLLPQLYALIAFAGVFNTWAILSYRKRG